MNPWLEFVFGAIGALLLIFFARKGSKQFEVFVFAVVLSVAALVYVLFALFFDGGANIRLESAGLVLFSIIAAIGRKFHMVLALGWAGHAAWDLFLHPVNAETYFPVWYPGLCAGFDLVVAVYLFSGSFRSRTA
jgi:Family of unknown function (DUF6010)